MLYLTKGLLATFNSNGLLRLRNITLLQPEVAICLLSPDSKVKGNCRKWMSQDITTTKTSLYRNSTIYTKHTQYTKRNGSKWLWVKVRLNL